MYVTAHRVWSRRTDQSGINVFLHKHQTPGDAVDWKAPNLLALVTEGTPGTLVNELIEVVPGGNEVQSHLDVVAPDGTTHETIREVLANAATVLSRGGGGRFDHGGVIVAFGCQLGMRGAERLEFEKLAAAVQRVLTEPPKPRVEGSPIRIRVLEENGALVCRLDGTEAARIQSLNGHPNELVSVRAARDVIEDFERLYGDIGPELAHVLTGLTRERLLAAGGVQFIDANTNRVLRQWPRPRE